MPNPPDPRAFPPAEILHGTGLGIAACALFFGLAASEPEWVKAGISLVILLPPVRLATSILGEVRARHFGVAAMGTLVLAFLVFSRRIS